MKYLTMILFIVLNVTNTSCQSIKGKGFEGCIFDKEHFALVSIKNQKSIRYTQSKDDILKAEKLLKESIKQMYSPLVNQREGCPIIHKNLKKYVRQYLGFVNNEGKKIICINFLWKKGGLTEGISKDIVNVSDGCSHYWKVKVNLATGKLFDLKINGSA